MTMSLTQRSTARQTSTRRWTHARWSSNFEQNNKWSAVARDLQIKWFGFVCSAHTYLPNFKLICLIVHARIQDYGKKEHDKKYGEKEEYKKVGTCKMEQHIFSLIQKNIWVAVTRNLHIKRCCLNCSAHTYLPKSKLRCSQT